MAKPAGDTASVGSAAASFGLASSASPSVIHIDPELRKCLAEVDTLLAIHVAAWMKKRGRSLRPKLTDEQRKQLEECFELMDADGSGAIDADELGAAFKLLGLDVSKADIAQMLAEVDEDGSGEVEYPEFIEIMTSTLSKLADKKEEEGAGGSQVPFALLATAYRRKRIMEGLISGDKDVMAQVTSIAEQAARRAADDAQRQLQLLHQQAQARQRHSNLPSSVNPPKASLEAGRHSIFRPNAASSNGSIDSSDRTAGVDTAAAAAAAAVAAAGQARAAQVTAQAGVSSGLLRALQHIKSFCSSHSGSARSSPGSSAASSKRTSLEVPAVLVRPIVPAPVAPAASGQGAIQEAEEDLVDLPVEAIAGVLDLEEQMQLISLLRAKTRKRLEALAVAAAAAGQPGSSCSNSRWPSVGGYLRSTGNSSSGALSSSGSGSSSTAAGSSSGAAQGPVGPGSTAPASAVDLEGLVGAKQRLTSKLMLKLLTQNVEAPKFALTSTVQRSSASGSNGNGNSSSNSPTPSLPGLYARGCRSATCSPCPYKQPSLTAVDAAGSANSSSPWNQQQQQQRKASGGLLPPAGDSGAAGQLSSSSGPPAASNGAGRRGINFGDTQVYAYDSQKGSSSRHGSSTGGSSSAGRVSEGGVGAGHSLSAMHRSKSLGVLSQDVLGHFCQPSAAPTAPAGGIVGAGSGGKPLAGSNAGSNTPFRSPSSSSTFNNNSSSGGSEKHRAPSRAKSTSALRSRTAAAALQQLGPGCVLSLAPKLEQQQQQWMPLPQLPHAAGCLHAAPCHQRSKSSSPICANSMVLSGSGSAVASAKQGALLGGQGSLPSVAGGVVARQPSGSVQSKRLL